MWISKREYTSLVQSNENLFRDRNRLQRGIDASFESLRSTRTIARMRLSEILHLDRENKRLKEEMAKMKTEYHTNGGVITNEQAATIHIHKDCVRPHHLFAPSNDNINRIDTEIQKLRDLLATPNLDADTIKLANEQLRQLMAKKITPQQEVWLDGK